MKRILIDVDTQFDFMDPEGALYVESDPSVSKAVKRLLMEASIDGIGVTYDAVIGSVDSHAYDAWEFKENGGPFPAHCVKGQPGWLRVHSDFPAKQRFIPMTPDVHDNYNKPLILVGESRQGEGPRHLTPQHLATEATEGNVGLYFEKEVYSLFDNPFAMPTLNAICNRLGGDWNKIQIDVIGYCTGGYCVDAAVEGLLANNTWSRANIRVLAYASAAIGGAEGMAKSKETLTALGAEWVERGP